MVDKMMRMSGRSEDGLAKPIQTDSTGMVRTSQSKKRKVLIGKVLSNGETLRSSDLSSAGFTSATLELKFVGYRSFKVTIVDKDVEAGVTYDRRRVIFNSSADESVSIDYDIISEQYYIEVEATSVSGLSVHSSYETLLQFKPTQKVSLASNKRQPFSAVVLTEGKTTRTTELNSLGHKYANLTLHFVAERSLKVTIVDVINGGQVKRVVFDGSGDNSISVDYELKSDKYYIEIEATSVQGLAIHKDSFETLSMFPASQKAISVTNKRQPFNAKVLAESETLRSRELNSVGHKYANLTLHFVAERAFKLSIIDVINGVQLKRVVFDGNGNTLVSVDYELKSDKYYIEVEATSVQGLSILNTNFETLTDSLPNTSDETNKRNPFKAKVLADGETLRSRKLNSVGHKYAKLVLKFVSQRAFKVSIIDIDVELGVTQERKRVVFDDVADESASIDYDIKSENYYIEVEATSVYGLSIHSSTFETLLHEEVLKNQIDRVKNEIVEVQKALRPAKPIKFPSKHLLFKDSPLDVQAMTKGTDDFYYIVDNDGLLKKYETIIGAGEAVETGLTWDTQTNGTLVYVFASGDGFVFFSNYADGSDNIPRIYRTDSIDGTLVKVYEDAITRSSVWSRQFGVDHYYNGTSYFLAGLYSDREPSGVSRDLILSTDGGRTFRVIKQTTNNDVGSVYNSHWHDVKIDYFHGLLWATEGDGPKNRHIWYSEDLGVNWIAIADNLQPTSIIAYPDKILFGRDGGNVGFDGMYYPDTMDELNRSLIHTYKEFKVQSSITYFAMKPVTYEGETYANFLLYGAGNSPMIVASGDYGESWHGVWLSTIPHGEVYNFIAADDNYIYAYKSNSDSTIVYSEKPKWI